MSDQLVPISDVPLDQVPYVKWGAGILELQVFAYDQRSFEVYGAAFENGEWLVSMRHSFKLLNGSYNSVERKLRIKKTREDRLYVDFAWGEGTGKIVAVYLLPEQKPL